MLRVAPVVYDPGKDIRELLIDEVKRRGTLRPDDFAGSHWRVVSGSEAKRQREPRRLSTSSHFSWAASALTSFSFHFRLPTLRVFVNSSAVDVPAGSSAIDT